MDTITDKKDFSCNVVDKSRYNSLSQQEKEYFEIFRNSILEIFPVENKNTYNDVTISYAERFAFIGIKTISKIVTELDEKLKKLEEKIAA